MPYFEMFSGVQVNKISHTTTPTINPFYPEASADKSVNLSALKKTGLHLKWT